MTQALWSDYIELRPGMIYVSGMGWKKVTEVDLLAELDKQDDDVLE